MICSKNKPGEISIFLSLIFIIIISFILIVIKSARLSFQKTRIEGSAEIAINSSFSEYNKLLFEKYHLLLIDTTYKGVIAGGDDSFREHFDQYFEQNLYSGTAGEYGLEFISSSVTNAVYATDYGYVPIVDEIRYYMADILGMKKDSDNEEILDSYIDVCISEYVELDLYDDIYEWDYDEKLQFVIDTINEDMKSSYGDFFDLTKHLYSAEVTVYVSSDLAKMYECRKEYSLK